MKLTIFSERVYVKHQMSILFSILVLFSFGATLGLCLGFLYTLGDKSQSTAEDRILSRTYHNAKTDGLEIAAAIEKRLASLAESTSMTTALYSTLLLQNNFISASDYRFPNRSTYREYNFVDNCVSPLCPSDFGPLGDRSRVPNMNGSIEATSLYLYSSLYREGIKWDSLWNSIMSDPLLRYTQETLAYQDDSLVTAYSLAEDVMFLYLSVQISRAGGGYDVLHRVFPGTNRNDNSYDPSQRSWFTHSPVDGITVQGPYVETFTKKYVLNLSSRKEVYLSLPGISTSGRQVTVVGATVLKLDSISRIVSKMQYPNDGFGVLLKYGTFEVIVWGNVTDTYDPIRNRFLTVADFDPTLADKDLLQRHAFQHVDPSGIKWVISSTPFMEVEDYQSLGAESSLILLVYSKWSDAFESIPVLNDSIDDTETSITLLITIIAVAVTVVLLIGINLFVVWLTGPLQTILDISRDIMKLSAEEEKNKNYLPFVDQGIRTSSTRTDEIGALSSIFWQMIWKLHQDNLRKKETPKHPSNPFYSPTLRSHSLFGSYLLNSADFSAGLFLSLSDLLKPFADAEKPKRVDQDFGASAPEMDGVGVEMASDVLSRIGYQLTIGQDLEAQGRDDVAQKPKATYQQILPISDPEEAKYPGRIVEKTVFTLGFHLSCIGLLIFLGLCSLVVITIVIIRSESYSWMDETGKSLTTQQISDLFTVTEAKAQFSKSYFDHVALDTQVMSRQLTSLLNDYAAKNSFPRGHELQSYSNDPNNYYASPSSPASEFSGYFFPDAAKCQAPPRCSLYHNNYTTRLTSLVDVQLRSAFHSRSSISFVQFGIEANGFSRTYPYGWTSYAEPTQCYIAYLETALCLDKYQNSQCSQGNNAPYPAYDPRCRSWYGVGSRAGASPQLTYFQEPRQASNGQFVVTAVAPLNSQSVSTGTKLGVFNVNAKATDLSESVNSFKILHSGYVYLLDAQNVSTVILHPRASSSCTTLLCCENDFTSEEYSQFLSAVSSLSSTTARDFVYSKGGRRWLLVNSGFQSATIDYLVIATVPMSEVLQPSQDVDDTIDSTVAVIIAVSVVVFFVFLVFIVFCIRLLIRVIQSPVNHLIDLCQKIISNDLTMSILAEEIRCRDMKVLLDTFRNIVIVLRFGNEAYISGNLRKAMEVYTEALLLYESIANDKGVSSCHNNLGGIYLTMKDLPKSEHHYRTSISLATEQLEKLTHLVEKSPSDQSKGQLASIAQTLSDRQANLSLLLIEQEKYPEAYALLESCLESDMKRGYINGCVNKQGYLGFLYLRQKEMKSAETQFLNSLLFLDNQQNQSRLLSEKWTVEELEVSKQIALFNYGKLYEEKKDLVLALHYYVMSLQFPAKMHPITTIKALSRLRAIYEGNNQLTPSSSADLLRKLETVCEAHLLNITHKNQSLSTKKRIAIALDYSGSMSGVKIRSAVENILSLFDDQMQAQDSLLLLHFNTAIVVDFPFTAKEGNEGRIRETIQRLNQPHNGTFLYDAIEQCVGHINTDSTSQDWIVILTDGEDSGSKISKETIRHWFSRGAYGVILIGVGNDVNHAEMEQLVQASAKGFYVKTSGDKDGITRAFGEVRNLMQENVVFEEI